MDTRLHIIRDRIKELQQKIDDAWWEGHKTFHMEDELERLINLSLEGHTLEPRF